MYERYCRRNVDTPTFESFNGKHFTCLPENKAAFDEYSRILVGARRAAGVPVTRRLPSLYKKLWNQGGGPKSFRTILAGENFNSDGIIKGGTENEYLEAFRIYTKIINQ